jgi:hypothetical protein
MSFQAGGIEEEEKVRTGNQRMGSREKFENWS